MSKLLKVIVMVTAATFVVACAKKPMPTTPVAPVEVQKTVKKCGGKHHKKCVSDKLGQTSFEKDTKK
jgi:hypothetical protein